MDLDKIYNCTLKEYLDLQGKTREQLVKELKIDIRILIASYKRYSCHNNNFTIDELLEQAVPIKEILDKKIKHLNRIKEWN